MSVCMWKIDFPAISKNVMLPPIGTPATEALADFIEGGKDGSLMKETKEYFHYAQIRT